MGNKHPAHFKVRDVYYVWFIRVRNGRLGNFGRMPYNVHLTPNNFNVSIASKIWWAAILSTIGPPDKSILIGYTDDILRYFMSH